MAKKPKKLKTPALASVPQSREECAAFIAEYGRIQAAKDAKLAQMNEAIRALSQGYEADLEALTARLEAQHKAIQAWCEPNRERLATEAGVKFIELTTGTVRWQKQPDRITAPRDAAKLAEAVEALREHGLERFVRVAEEVNKEAMLAEKKPDDGSPGLEALLKGIPHLSLSVGKEAFIVEPLEVVPS